MVKTGKIVIFDGECGFCNSTIVTFARKDQKNELTFVSNLSKEGFKILSRYDLTSLTSDTIIFITNDNIYTKSRAIKEIMKTISGYKTLLFFYNLIPIFILDYFYSTVSKYRRLLKFKRKCELPEKEIMDKIVL